MFTDRTSLKKISLCSAKDNSSFPMSRISSNLSLSNDTFKHLQTKRAILSIEYKRSFKKNIKIYKNVVHSYKVVHWITRLLFMIYFRTYIYSTYLLSYDIHSGSARIWVF